MTADVESGRQRALQEAVMQVWLEALRSQRTVVDQLGGKTEETESQEKDADKRRLDAGSQTTVSEEKPLVAAPAAGGPILSGCRCFCNKELAEICSHIVAAPMGAAEDSSELEVARPQHQNKAEDVEPDGLATLLHNLDEKGENKLKASSTEEGHVDKESIEASSPESEEVMGEAIWESENTVVEPDQEQQKIIVPAKQEQRDDYNLNPVASNNLEEGHPDQDHDLGLSIIQHHERDHNQTASNGGEDDHSKLGGVPLVGNNTAMEDLSNDNGGDSSAMVADKLSDLKALLEGVGNHTASGTRGTIHPDILVGELPLIVNTALGDKLMFGNTTEDQTSDPSTRTNETIATVLPQHNSTADNVKLVKDNSAADNVTLVSDNPKADNVKLVKDNPTADNLMLVNDNPTSRNVTLVKDNPTADNVTLVKDNPTADNVTLVKDNPTADNVTLVKDNPTADNLTLVKDNPAADNMMLVKDNPTANNVTLVKDNPTAGNMTLVKAVTDNSTIEQNKTAPADGSVMLVNNHLAISNLALVKSNMTQEQLDGTISKVTLAVSNMTQVKNDTTANNVTLVFPKITYRTIQAYETLAATRSGRRFRFPDADGERRLEPARTNRGSKRRDTAAMDAGGRYARPHAPADRNVRSILNFIPMLTEEQEREHSEERALRDTLDRVNQLGMKVAMK